MRAANATRRADVYVANTGTDMHNLGLQFSVFAHGAAFMPAQFGRHYVLVVLCPWYALTCHHVSFHFTGVRADIWRAQKLGGRARRCCGAWTDRSVACVRTCAGTQKYEGGRMRARVRVNTNACVCAWASQCIYPRERARLHACVRAWKQA